MIVSFEEKGKIQLIIADCLHLTSFLARHFVRAASWFNFAVSERQHCNSKLDLTKSGFLILSAHYADNDGDVSILAGCRHFESWWLLTEALFQKSKQHASFISSILQLEMRMRDTANPSKKPIKSLTQRLSQYSTLSRDFPDCGLLCLAAAVRHSNSALGHQRFHFYRVAWISMIIVSFITYYMNWFH